MQVHIPHNREQPRPSPTGVAELAKMQLSFAESLLGQVFRIGTAPGQPISISIQSDIMLIDQPLHILFTPGQTHGGQPLRKYDPRSE
jgi:hypothetical protein